MSIIVSWHNKDKHILKYDFVGRWNWDELYDALSMGRKMMHSENCMVHIICNFSQSAILPDASIRRLRDIADTRPTNTGTVFIAGNHYLLIMLYKAFSRVYPDLCQVYKLAQSVDDAVNQIANLPAEHT